MFQSSRRSKINLWILIAAIGILALLFAFSPSQPVTAQVISPEVGEDGWVTFRYYDPTATSVQLYGEWGRNELGAMCYSDTGWPILDMTMDADGVWSYTIQLEPNFYNYHFVVDSVIVLDPSNPPWHPEALNNQVYVPDPDYEWVAVQDVPHGKLQVEEYYSDITDPHSIQPYAVYLPPDYDKNNRKYPLLILSHGGGGNHIDWTTQGLANNILDNLIAEHKIRPMIVVMTNFNDVFLNYRADLLNNVIPDVEAKFRVNKNPQQRGFAGLSLGGYLAADILMNAPSEFGYIGVWSGFVPYVDLQPNLDDIQKMRGIDISVGGQDFLYDFSVNLMSELDTYGIPYTGLLTPGDCHTWYFWREALYEFLTGPFLKGNN